jgi:serine/threonine protein phosphatase PrpC
MEIRRHAWGASSGATIGLKMMWASRVVAARAPGQDRARIDDNCSGHLVIRVADGAGGVSHGGFAAQSVVDAVPPEGRDWEAWLVDLEPALAGGQTTAVVMTIDGGSITGASVGDSIAWLVPGGTLTANQQRKPLLGDGAVPIGFRGSLRGTLLVATDGLWRYAPREAIERCAQLPDLEAAADALVALVQPLQDDVAVVLVRAA